MSHRLSPAQENYLKAIYFIVQKNKVARVKDIAKSLNIGPSSVSEGIKPLAEKALINYEPYGLITLTDSGLLLAENIAKKYEIIATFLTSMLDINEDLARENAGKMISNISPLVLERFVRFIDFTQTCQCKSPKWMNSFKSYSSTGEMSTKCEACVKTGGKKGCNSDCCGNNTSG